METDIKIYISSVIWKDSSSSFLSMQSASSFPTKLPSFWTLEGVSLFYLVALSERGSASSENIEESTPIIMQQGEMKKLNYEQCAFGEWLSRSAFVLPSIRQRLLKKKPHYCQNGVDWKRRKKNARKWLWLLLLLLFSLFISHLSSRFHWSRYFTKFRFLKCKTFKFE